MQSFNEKIYICLEVSWFGNVIAYTLFQNEGERTPYIFLPYQGVSLNYENCILPTFYVKTGPPAERGGGEGRYTILGALELPAR